MGKKLVTVKVNGRTVEKAVEPRQLLVHFLREECSLTGTHIGCETTLCGACTVHLDGKAVKSCTLLAVQADGCEVRTIEGMGWELFHRLLAVASGERTWAERHRLHNALVLFNPAPVT